MFLYIMTRLSADLFCAWVRDTSKLVTTTKSSSNTMSGETMVDLVRGGEMDQVESGSSDNFGRALSRATPAPGLQVGVLPYLSLGLTWSDLECVGGGHDLRVRFVVFREILQ
jgi:hypothetical protein